MNHQPPKVCLFIRVSTDKQDYQRQILELTEFCKQKNFIVAKTIATKVTGTKTFKDRDDLKELFGYAEKKMFNKVVVCEISRIGRNAKDIRNTIDFLHTKGISIVFKNLGGLESLDENGNESFVTNVIVSIYAELAQEERRILSERIKSGLDNARHKGLHIGRPKGSEDEDVLLQRYSRLATDIQKGFSLRQCMKLHVVSKNTVIKIKKTLLKVETAVE